MRLEKQQTAIKALGQLEEIKYDMRDISSALAAIDKWKPAAVLKRQQLEAVSLIESIEARLDRMLVISIIGASGSGKSTLLNALAGVDELSETGVNRPTTRRLIILSKNRYDADMFVQHFGGDEVQIKTSPAALRLEYALLVDTPDVDTAEQDDHLPLVHQAIKLSDVLICLFNAENPKRKDYIDFLTPYINLFSGDSLICAINRCDRLDEAELKTVILPEFKEYLRRAWDRTPESVLCICARRHLENPGWDSKSPPKHEFDEFEILKNLIFGTFNHAGFVIDRRLESAEQLKNFFYQQVSKEVEHDRVWLEKALEKLSALEKNALNDSLAALSKEKSSRMIGINVLLYQKLAQKWMGPVGWVIAVWARILIFGAGITAVFRFGNPFHQLYGIFTSLSRFKETRAAVAKAGESVMIRQALKAYHWRIQHGWHDIVDLLQKGRFSGEWLYPDQSMAAEVSLEEDLTELWNQALDEALESYSRKLSSFLLQAFLNLPGIGLLGYIGWVTADNFFQGKYLPGDFFVHAFVTLFIILLLCFFLFQFMLRIFSSAEKIVTAAFSAVKQQTETNPQGALNPLREQLNRVLLMNTDSSLNSKTGGE